jgi:precorrin-2 dehydrogenase/sirohydrochlorin ferrochelatase
MTMPDGYPMVLDVSDRLAVIVGGGAVGTRKARGLLSSGAKRVRVVSPVFNSEMPVEVQRIAEIYRREHLEGAALVFAATDEPQVNQAVVDDAHKIGALVSRADGDDDNAADFSTPAMLRQGSLLITVSSGGSPALSAMIRDRLKHAIDPRWIKMSEAMQALRPLFRQRLTPQRRRDVMRSLCCEEALDLAMRMDADAFLEWIRQRFPGIF